MNLHQLAVFQAVAATSSMTQAAERLGVSQPAVSKQVQELEESVGVALFDRAGRGVRLTRAGELLAGYAERIVGLRNEAERAVGELRGLERGKLVLGVSTTIGFYLLPPVLAEFHRCYPGVEVLVRIGNTEEIHRQLMAGEVDVVLSEGFVEPDDLVGERFWVDRLVVIASSRHPLADRNHVSLTELATEPFILREPGSGIRAVTEKALADLGISVRVAMALGSTEAVKRVVVAGVGVAIVSHLSADCELQANTLVVLPVPEFHVERPLHIVRLRGRQDGPTVRAFLDRLRNQVKAVVTTCPSTGKPLGGASRVAQY